MSKSKSKYVMKTNNRVSHNGRDSLKEMVWKDLYDKGMFNLIKRICLFGELLKSIPGIGKSKKKKKKGN